MNRGTFRGFTWQTLPSDATFPEMKVRYIPYQGNLIMGSGNIDTLHQVDSNTAAVSIELNGAGMKEGQCIHIAQWGSNGVTFTNTDGLLRCAGTATTRTQYSTVTAMLVNATLNEFLVFGDITV